MNERVDTTDPVIVGFIATNQISIIIPPGLVVEFMQLAFDYATQHRENPLDCLRGVEITILQRGISSMREELKANAALGQRFGWAKEEESGT